MESILEAIEATRADVSGFASLLQDFSHQMEVYIDLQNIYGSHQPVEHQNVRLANQQITITISGRLEVYNNSTNGWGTVCDDSFTESAAEVVCRMFGYSAGVARCCAYSGEGSLPILMDEVTCNGNELSIFDCSYAEENDCQNYEDVAVACTL